MFLSIKCFIDQVVIVDSIMAAKRKCLGPETRQCVLNAVEYFNQEKDFGGPLTNVLGVQKRTADCLKIGLRTVQRVCSLHNTGEDVFKKNTRDRRKCKSTDVPDAVKTEVRQAIYGMYSRKIRVTLKTILEEVVTIKQIWEFKKTSLWKLVKSLGFRFKKTDNRKGLCEQSHVVTLRHKFLKAYVENLDCEYPLDVVFLDETWIFSKGKF